MMFTSEVPQRRIIAGSWDKISISEAADRVDCCLRGAKCSRGSETEKGPVEGVNGGIESGLEGKLLVEYGDLEKVE